MSILDEPSGFRKVTIQCDGANCGKILAEGLIEKSLFPYLASHRMFCEDCRRKDVRRGMESIAAALKEGYCLYPGAETA